MSATGSDQRRITVADLQKMRDDGTKIAMLTAYDYPTAKLLDEAGIPILLVGDSVGTNMLGYDNETRVTMADMLHHVAAVVRGTKRSLVIADMPFLSYASPEEAVDNAGRFLQDAGAQAVKIEGGVRSARIVEALTRAGIAVMGHIGWTPQARETLGGKVRIQGKSAERARSLLADALALQEAGAFSMVLELVPEQLAGAITDRLRVPTIGIGAGPLCSGQVQIITDILGTADWQPKHAKRFANLRETILNAATRYAAEVTSGAFPGPEQTVRMDDSVLDEVLGRSALDRGSSQMPAGIPLDRDL